MAEVFARPSLDKQFGATGSDLELFILLQQRKLSAKVPNNKMFHISISKRAEGCCKELIPRFLNLFNTFKLL